MLLSEYRLQPWHQEFLVEQMNAYFFGEGSQLPKECVLPLQQPSATGRKSGSSRVTTIPRQTHETSFYSRKPIPFSRWSWTVLLALWLAIYFAATFRPALLDDADSVHAIAAQHMADTSDYVTLKVNGIRYLEKAPYLYWLTSTSYRIFGQNEFARDCP
jgi:hypothetical protein